MLRVIRKTYFYEKNFFDTSSYTYANLRSMVHISGYYMGILESDKDILFVYSENGVDFNEVKVSDIVSKGITSAVFTLASDDFDANIVILYGDTKYTCYLSDLRYDRKISFMDRYFSTPPSGAKNPNQLQYVSGKYYLNEGYNSNSDSSGGIWTSTDGLAWEKVYDGACETLLIKDESFWMSQPSNSVSSPSLERGIYTSTDLQNWTCVWKPIDFSESHGAVDFQYVNNEFIFTTYYNIYKSTDGLSWDKVVPLGAGSLPKNNLTYDSSENQWLWYSCLDTSSEIYTSDDLLNWKLLYSHSAKVTKSVISIIPMPNKIILFTSDVCKSWQALIHDHADNFFIPLSAGGTGASSKEQARKNLEVYSKSEIDSMLPQKTTTLMVIHVSPSGNDSSGNGTEEKPYRTIQKALSVVPQIIIYTVIIRLAPGTYTGVTISGFSGEGSLQIQGASSLEAADDYIISSRIEIVSNTVYEIYVVGVKNTYGEIGTLIHGNSSSVKLKYYKSCPDVMQSYGTGITIGAGMTIIWNSYIENAYIGLRVAWGGNCVVYQLEVGETASSNILVEQGGQVRLMDMPVLKIGNISKSMGGSIIYPNGTFNKS